MHYTDDETIRQGSAQFKLTNTQTKRSETLRCDLRYNYNCEFLGTPHDREVRVWFQANVADVSVTVAAPWRCDSGGRGRGSRGGRRASVTGTTEMKMECSEWAVGAGTGGKCKGGREGGLASARVVLDAEGTGEADEVRAKGKGEPPPFPMTGRYKTEKVVGNPIFGMARRGRAMAKALAHHQQRHPEEEEAEEGDGLKGETKLSRHEEKKGNEKEGKSKGKGKEKRDEEVNEKRFIDQVEHRLCSPSCLREAIPEPASGSRYTNGFSKKAA